MKTWASLVLCISMAFSMHAQTVTVLEKQTMNPVEGVTIRGDNTSEFAFTDKRGWAAIPFINGAVTIEFTALGYETLRLAASELNLAHNTIYLKAKDISLDQVVVSASRWKQSSRDIPVKVSTITQRDIALFNPQTAADLLNTSGEVYVQKSQQGGGSPMIRGFSSNRLLYAVDGIRMNTAIFRSGNLHNVISLDPFAISKTEVMFGPGSILYGSDAIGGVMRFQTLQPRLAATDKTLVSGNAMVRTATANNELSAHIDFNVGGKRFSSLTSLSTSNYGDLKMGGNGPEAYLRPWYVERVNDQDIIKENDDEEVQVPTGYSQVNLMQKFRFKASDDWELDYDFHYSRTSDFDRYDRLIQEREGQPWSAEWKYGPQVWMMNHVEADHRAELGMYDRMTIHLAHQYFEESRIDRDFQDNIRNHREEKVDAWSANVDLHKTLSDRSQLFYGLELVYNKVRSNGWNEDILTDTKVNGPSRYPDSDWYSYAAYANFEYDLTPEIVLEAGARYNIITTRSDFSENQEFYPLPDDNTRVDNGALTGSLGLNWNPSDDWSVRWHASSGFRAPNVDDIGKVFDSAPGTVVVPNPSLKPEYAYNLEVGAAKLFGKFVKAEISCYYTWLDQAMVRRNFTINGMDSIMYDGELSQVQAIQNAASAYVYGVQAGIEVKLPGGLGILSRFNYQNGEEKLEDGSTGASRHVAPMFGLTRLTYGNKQLKISLTAHYNGSIPFEDLAINEREKPHLYAIDENGNPYAPGWFTLGLELSYDITDWFTLTGGMENITNERYRPYSSGLAGAGRNFILALRAKL